MTWRTALLRACGLASLALLVGVVASSRSTVAASPTNILLVVADDFGVDTSPCYGAGTDKPWMPTLERLCREGLVFDRFWTAPECSPTRATILTGRYGFRLGIGAALRRSDPGLATSELSLHTFISQQPGTSLSSAVIGKWHLATDANGWAENPGRMGVSHYAGLLSGGAESYSRWSRTEDGLTAVSTAYITTQLTDDAVAWIGRQKTAWFLWLAYTAPHEPLHLPPASLHGRADLPGTAADMTARPRLYQFAMAEAMDRELGRLLDSLDESTRARTVVIFIGDNGTAPNVVPPSTDRTRAKSTLYEGGIHTPLVVSGAGVTRSGQRESALVNSVDLFSTIAQLGGSPVARWHDSESFAALLSDPAASKRTEAYSEYFGSDRPALHGWTIRDERFKLIVYDSGQRRLFDLANDPAELRDLSASSDPAAQQALSRLRQKGEGLRSSR